MADSDVLEYICAENEKDRAHIARPYVREARLVWKITGSACAINLGEWLQGKLS
jgi:hypothetical protein